MKEDWIYSNHEKIIYKINYKWFKIVSIIYNYKINYKGFVIVATVYV